MDFYIRNESTFIEFLYSPRCSKHHIGQHQKRYIFQLFINIRPDVFMMSVVELSSADHQKALPYLQYNRAAKFTKYRQKVSGSSVKCSMFNDYSPDGNCRGCNEQGWAGMFLKILN